jgi:hypothetical protein
MATYLPLIGPIGGKVLIVVILVEMTVKSVSEGYERVE